MKKTKNERDFAIRQRGRQGEKYVCDYLEKNGYNIIMTNYSSRFGEVDIIAECDSFLVFVEVKTRTESSLAGGFESITESKIKKFTKTALEYIVKNGTQKQPRIDCAEVIVDKNDNSMIKISYIENAVDDWGLF